MRDERIIAEITSLVDEEHQLRTKRQSGQIDTDEEKARLRQLEEALDQCWDLLRRRRAAREAGTDPDDVEAQPIDQVEGYLQ